MTFSNPEVIMEPQQMPKGTGLGGRTMFAVGMVVVASWAAMCPPQQPAPSPNVAEDAHPECPQGSDLVKVIDSGRVTKIISTIPLSGLTSQIVEYHDCQRFVEGHHYGALYAIFADSQLDRLPFQLLEADSQAHLEGRSYGPVAVATIYSYGGTYGPLHIVPGFNCLFVFRKPDPSGHGDTLGAVMLPQDNSDCRLSPADSLLRSAPPLQARAWSSPDLAGDDYPPVARWDWDPRHHQQYIGIGCGAAWCEVGEKGFVSSPAYQHPTPPFDPVPSHPSNPHKNARVTEVKGWYDEQRLAIKASDGTAQPSEIWGTLIPDPVLGELDNVTDFDRKWIPVAIADVSYEYEKLGFERGLNRIYLCRGNIGENGCPVSENVHVPACSGPSPDGSSWWAMTVPPSADTVIYCVWRRDHSAQLVGQNWTIPGVVRWRWLVDDETNWVRCPSGCCELKP